MDTKQELTESYSAPEYRAFAPVPFTKPRHYVHAGIFFAVFALLGAMPQAIGAVIFVGSFILFMYGVKLHLWNKGVKRYGAAKWIKFIGEKYNKDTSNGVD